MTPERAEQLLQGYAFGTLTSTEVQELSTAALDDEELFLKMADADDQRRVLAHSDVRAEALRIVRQAAETTPAWRRALNWLARPVVVVPAIGLAALLTLITIRTIDPPGDRHTPAGVAGQLASLEARDVAQLQPTGAGPGLTVLREDWMDSIVDEGTKLSLRVQVNAPASLVVIQELSDGSARFVFPESLMEPSEVAAGEHRVVLEASPSGSSITGSLRLVVAAFALGTEVRLPGSDLEAARQRMTRRDIRYGVRTP